MTDTKVRLVRCPKCQNVLPELADYSVYQCGGCGAVLRAKAKHSEVQTPSGLAERVGIKHAEKSGNSSPIGVDHSTDLTSNGSSFRSEKRVSETDAVGRDENFESSVDGTGVNEVDRIECTDALVSRESGEDIVHGEIAMGSREIIMRTEADMPNASTSNNLDEGTKGCKENGSGQSLDGHYKPSSGDIHQDKEEILRKLEELRQQLSRLPDCNAKPGITSNHNPRFENRYYEEYAAMHDAHANHTYPSMYTRAPLASGDPCRSHVSMGVSLPQQHPFLIHQHPSNAYCSGQYVDPNIHPYASCSLCYCGKTKAASGPIPPVGFCHHEHLFNPSNCNTHPAQLARWQCVIGCGNDSGPRPTRVFLPNTVRTCRPIAGGAPFITCSKCLEVLKLPDNLLRDGKANTVRCGACSALITFSITNGKLLFSPCLGEKEVPFDDIDYGIKEVVNGGSNSDYEFNNPQETQSRHPSSTGSKNANSSELPAQGNLSPPPAGSPLQEHFDYSSNNHRVNRFGNGNRSTRSDQDKVVVGKGASRQSSVKDVALESETESSSNEGSNLVSSQDSGITGKEEGKTGVKAGDSFLAGIKKSLRDLARSNQVLERSKVMINGYPVADRKLKKAEKLAGPIYPGQYWYDYRAGFWGVMGGPCLGIVPPYIEELNFPLPENCAGGITGIFVNGRELHQKDLDLLANRGLPTNKNRYIIEISGKVLEAETGEVLEGLGKLAPTVEKMKRGFGMKPSKISS